MYCKKEYQTEPVKCVYEGNATMGTKMFPDFSKHVMQADIDQMKKDVLLDHLTDEEVAKYLTRMSLPCSIYEKGVLFVDVPITRSDVMHQCDLVEDLAIAYGYNNLKADVPQTLCLASEQPLNHLTDLIRNELASAGFCEALTFGLLSNKENFENLRREPDPKHLYRPAAKPHEYLWSAMPVRLSNPKTKEFEVCRTSLLPGLLLTLQHNKKNQPPFRLFEVSDVVIQNPEKETGACNQRRAAGVYGGMTSGFEIVHGAVDHILAKLNSQPDFKGAQGVNGLTFELVPGSDPAFFPGMHGSIMVNGIQVGVVGVLHPEVVTAFGIPFAASAFELNLEPFVSWL